MTDAPTRPALRYHGGKWRLAPWIIGHFPPHKVYVEPFGGAASVLLRKPRAYVEVYNDLDGEIVNLFRVLREPAQARELRKLLRLTPFARGEFAAAYFGASDPIEQARRTIVKAFMGFGSGSIQAPSGFRSNSTRSGTVPAHDWVNYPDQINAFCKRLTGVIIENRPAGDVMQTHDARHTLHYVDPPYVSDTRGTRHIYRHEMTDEDHHQLSEILHSLRGMVILSGYASGLYNELYSGWHCIERDAFADGARARTESLWLSPRTWAALQSGAGLPLFRKVDHV